MTASTPPRKREVRGGQAAAIPARPTHLRHGRWLGDLEGKQPLSEAEKALIAACARGVAWEPAGWDEVRPETEIPANSVRAALIRFLLLGGDSLNPVHERGVTLGGAWIAGELDLYQADCAVRLALIRCNFDKVPNFRAATLPELVMSGSAVPGINADRLIVKGGASLGDGFEATSEVRLLGAHIGDDLDCVGGTFANKNGTALNADGIVVKGSVLLRDGFEAMGEVRLLTADIGGALSCSGGAFMNGNGFAFNADGVIVKGNVFLSDGFAATGEVRLLGADIGGDLYCSGGTFANGNGDALSADRMIVKGSVFLDSDFEATGKVRLLSADIGSSLYCHGGIFTNGNGKALSADRMIVNGDFFLLEAKITGAISLASVKVGTMTDDTACWASGGHFLDGFQYDRIAGPTDAETRIDWLKKQQEDHLKDDFSPQPWHQLIKVLRDMGHLHEASVVAIAMQNALRKAKKIKGIRNPLHWVYGKLAGYGYRPMNTVVAMAFVWLVMGFAFWAGADGYAAIGPANPVITSEALYPDAGQLCGHGNETGKTRWTECAGVPDEYSTFQPFIYSLDLILPLVDLQQESDWAPIAEGPTGRDLLAGAILRWLMWFEILFGWTASLILVAVLGRLVEKD